MQNVVYKKNFWIQSQKDQKGFSLIELALVLLVVGILTSGGLSVFSSVQDQRAYQQTDQAMLHIQDALIGHYLQFGRLPCPDTDFQLSSQDYGYEKPKLPTGVCNSDQGWLPHLTLGLGDSDAWGNRYRYVVYPLFTELPDSPPQVCSQSSRQEMSEKITIQMAENVSKTLAEWVAFAVISTGKNGKQTNVSMSSAFSGTGGCSSLTSVEQENCNAGFSLNAGQVLSDGKSIHFDDRVIWVSDLQLISGVRKAGLCF